MCELLGNLIRQRRKKLGMNQTQLAQLIGVSTPVISTYERNMVSGPSLVVVRKLEVALGVEKGTFFS